jgi:hypothetical protein
MTRGWQGHIGGGGCGSRVNVAAATVAQGYSGGGGGRSGKVTVAAAAVVARSQWRRRL